MTRCSVRADLDREAGSGAVGHMTARGCMSYSLSYLEACARGTRFQGTDTIVMV
jgi:hypothetical protein